MRGYILFPLSVIGEERLFVDVWYPAQRREIESLATYDPFSFRGKAYRDAPVAKTNTKLIAFSHGLLSVRFQMQVFVSILRSMATP